MEDKTKIDELFKQGLSGFSAEPPADAWTNIQDTMTAARRKKRIAFWRIAGTAAAVVLAFFSGYYFDTTTRNINSGNEVVNPVVNFSTQGSSGQWNNSVGEQQVTDEQNAAEEINTEKAGSSSNSTKNSNVTGIAAESSNNLALADEYSRKTPNSLERNLVDDKVDLTQNSESDNSNVKTKDLAFNPQVQKTESPAIDEVKTPVTEESEAPPSDVAYVEANAVDSTKTLNKPELEVEDEPFVYEDTKSSKKKKRYDTRGTFDLGAVASPTFAFNDVSNQPAQQTAGNANLGTAYTPSKQQSDKLQNSYAAGLNLSYRTSPRWEVSTGLHLNNWNQVSSDVFLTADTYTGTTTGGFTARGNTSTGPVTYNTGSNFYDATKFDNTGPNEYYLIPDIQQQYQFLEVPLRVGYYLFDSQKWSFKVQAGFSGRFLTHSDVKLVFEDGSTEDYDGLAVKDFSLQLVGGTGLSYKATKNLSINLTPSVLYGLTPVNTNSGIETYFHQFLVYTGLTYGF